MRRYKRKLLFSTSISCNYNNILVIQNAECEIENIFPVPSRSLQRNTLERWISKSRIWTDKVAKRSKINFFSDEKRLSKRLCQVWGLWKTARFILIQTASSERRATSALRAQILHWRTAFYHKTSIEEWKQTFVLPLCGWFCEGCLRWAVSSVCTWLVFGEEG